jgi:hypothetical protein
MASTVLIVDGSAVVDMQEDDAVHWERKKGASR